MDGEDPDGGSAALVQLIDEHGAAVLIDFLDYGIDLVKVLPAVARGESEYTPRLLLSIAQQFGEGTATYAALIEVPESRGWTHTDDLLVAVCNDIRLLIQVGANGIPLDKRHYFEMHESPITRKHSKKSKQRTLREVLMTDTGNDPLPAELMSK